MALNIPTGGLPGEHLMRGWESGEDFYNKLMKQALAQKQLQQQQQQFAQNMGFRQQAQERAAQLDPMKMALMKAQINSLNRKPAIETAEQKRTGRINQAIAIDEAKSTRKKMDEIEKTAQLLLPYVGHVNTISDILKRKPEFTGRLTQLADKLSLTKDEDVGTFLSAAQELQSQMAHKMSRIGGFGVSKLVEQAKPHIGKSPAYNIGVTKELKKGMKASFDLMKKEYERLGPGQKFPYDFEQYFEESQGQQNNNATNMMVPMISPNGKRVMIPSDQVEAALAAGGRRG